MPWGNDPLVDDLSGDNVAVAPPVPTDFDLTSPSPQVPSQPPPAPSSGPVNIPGPWNDDPVVGSVDDPALDSQAVVMDLINEAAKKDALEGHEPDWKKHYKKPEYPQPKPFDMSLDELPTGKPSDLIDEQKAYQNQLNNAEMQAKRAALGDQFGALEKSISKGLPGYGKERNPEHQKLYERMYEFWQGQKKTIEKAKNVAGSSGDAMLVNMPDDPNARKVYMDTLREEWKKLGPISLEDAYAKKKLEDLLPFKKAIVGAAEANQVREAANNLSAEMNGEKVLTDKERTEATELLSKLALSAEQFRVRGGEGFAAKVLGGTWDMVPFAAELLSGGGLGAAASKGVASLGVKAAGKLGLKGVAETAVKTGAKLAGWGARGVTQAVTAFAPRSAEDSLRRQTQDYTITDDGQFVIDPKSGEKPFIATLKAIGDMSIEAMSEAAGGVLGKAGGAVVRSMPATKRLMGKVTEKLGEAWMGKTGRTANEFMKEMASKAGYHGVLEEMGEERLGDVMRAVTGVQDFNLKGDKNTIGNRLIAAIPNGEQLLQELVQFSIPGAVTRVGARAVELMETEPEIAAQLAKMQSPSRADFKRLGLHDKLSAEERAQLAEAVRQGRQTPLNQEFQEDVSKLTPEEQFARAQAQPVTHGPGAVEQPVPAQQPAPTEIAPPAPTVQAQPAAQEQAKTRKRLQSQEEVGTEALKAQGWTDQDIKEAKAQGLWAVDNVTGFQEGRTGTARMDTLKRAQEHVVQTGEDGVYLELDLRNLGGLNEARGHEGGNKVYAKIAKIIQEEVDSTGGDAQKFRHGGDEMSAVIVNAPQKLVDEAVARAQIRVDTLIREEGLDKIPHPKRALEQGVGIHFGSAEIRKEDTLEEILSRADTALEARKKAASPIKVASFGDYANEQGKPTEAPGPVAPSGRRGGAPKGIAGEGREVGGGKPGEEQGLVGAEGSQAPVQEDLSSLSREELFKRAHALNPKVKSGTTKSALIDYLKHSQYAQPKPEGPKPYPGFNYSTLDNINLREMAKERGIPNSMGMAVAKLVRAMEAWDKEHSAKPKALYEMNLDELQTLEDRYTAGEEADLVKALGAEGAKEFKRLQRRANSMDDKKAIPAQRQLDDIEDGMSQEQKNLVYGYDLEHSAEEVTAFRRQLDYIDSSGTPGELARAIGNSLIALGDKTDPAEMDQRQQIAYASLRHAQAVIKKNGWDAKQVSDMSLKSVISKYPDPADAEFMLRRFIKEESNVRRRLRKPDDEGAHEGQPKAQREKETQAEIPLPKKGQKVKFNPQDALEPNRQRKALHGVVKSIETANGKQFAVVAADGRTWTVPIEKAGRFQGEALRENEQQRLESEYTPKQVKWIEKASSDSRILASRYVAPLEAEIREKHILDPQKPLTAAANAELQDKLDSFMRRDLGMEGSGHDAQAKALPFVLEAVMEEAEKGTVLPKLKSVEFVGAVSEGDTITLGARKWKAVKEAEGGRLTLKAENGDEIQFYRNYVPIDKGTKRRRGERKAAMRKGEPRPEVKPDVKVEPETQAKVVNETDLLGQERARVEGAGGAVEQGQMFDNEVSPELARERRLKQAHREAGGREFEFEESDEGLDLPEKPDDDIPFYDADKDPFSGSVQMEPGAKPIGNHEIIATMEREFGVPIKVGRVPGRPAGFYKLHDELVRLKGNFAGDLGVATHEVAHHIDQKTGVRKAVPRKLRKELAALDYDPKKKRVHEGWAEFIRHLLTEDDAKQVAPNFYTWFQDEWLPSHPHFAQRLATTKDYINRWRAQGAEARVKAGISKTGKPAEALDVGLFARAKEKIGAFIDRQTAAWVNDIHYTTLYERLAREQGYDPKEGDSPSEYIAAMSQAGPALATTAVLHGVFNVSATNMDKIGPSLKEAFEDIGREEYETFVSWMYARHARESWSKGKNPGISKVDADYVYEKYKDNARYKKAANTLTAFNNALVDMLANAGVIKHESAERMRTFYETYIPLMRVKNTLTGQRGLGAKNLLNLGSPVFGRRGSGLQVIDPVVATMERAVRFYTRATQQVAIEKVVNVARNTPGMGGWATRVAPHMVKTQFSAAEAIKQLESMGVEFNEADISDEVLESMLEVYKPLYQGKESEGIARIIGKDKTELWQFDKDLYRSIAGMNYLELPAFLEMTLGAGTRAVRLGATGINLIFGQMNVVRDYPAYLFQEKHQKGVGKLISPFVATASFIQSEVQRLRGKDENPHAQLWKEFGGPLSTILGLDRKQLSREIDSLMAKNVTGRVLDAAKHPLDLAREIIGISEVGPRLAEFKAVMEAHGYDVARLARMRKIGARPPTHVIIKAMNAAHEVTINFKRSGYYGKYVNRMIPYFNPTIQGLSKYARTWKDMPKRTTLYASMLAVGSLLYYMVKKDEDWYREAPPWLKYGFWTISDDDGKPIARIPRSFEWGWTISAGAEAIADATYRKDPKEFERYSKELLQRQVPNMKPSLITPALEVFFNYDLHRQAPIVSSSQLKRKPEDQYHPETTELMKAIGKFLGMSPAKLEHLAEQTTGGLFGRAERGIEGMVKGEGAPKELLGVGAFDLKRDYSQSTSEFYTKLKEVEQAYNSAKDKGQDTPKMKAEHKRLEEFAGIMSDLRADIKDEKDRDKRFEHEKYIIGLSRFALGKDALDRYPNPLGADSKDLPPAVAAIRDEYLGRLAYRLTTPRPERKKGEPLAEFQERKAEYDREFEEAQDFIAEIDLDRQELFRLLQIEAKRRGYKTNLWVGNRRSSYGERLLRLRRAVTR